MKTITIIDLLNKIANKEDIPKHFKYDDMIFTLEEGCYKDEEYENLLNSLFYDFSNLNDEIEIIEDTPNEIEKIDLVAFRNSTYEVKIKLLISRINEIIDYLESRNNE